VYDYTDSINSPLETIGQVRENFLYVINKYGPKLPTTQVSGSYGDTVDINQFLVLGTNEGEYDVTDTNNSQLEIISELKEQNAYIINKYVSGTGTYGNPELVSIDDLEIQTTSLPYANSSSTYIFLPSTYTPYSILLSDNPNGSDGTLSQDSALAQIGAKQLNKEFKHRVALELLQQTLGRVNVLDSTVNPDTGEISSKPNTDPFDAIGLLAGQIPIYSKDYSITNPDIFLGQAINFASRIAGVYSPYSFIPGEYFDYPDKKGSAIFNNPLSAIGGAVGGVFRLLQPNSRSASELFTQYTTVATRGLLYDQLRYNVYRPDYKFGENLLAPQGNYYIGKRKSQLTEIVSPDGELPESKIKGVAASGPVFSYGKIGQEYEGTQMDRPYTGLNSRPYIDSLNGVQGGFTWISKAGKGGENWMIPGNFAGPGGSVFQDNSEFNFSQISSTYEPTQSTLYEFTNGSILDVTQKLVDAGNRSNNKLEHVGNAINQVSKVFNDGYIELTKGSRVIRYTTKNSVPESSITPTGYEYCRVFTKDRPYMDFDELQKTDGIVTEGRRFTNSVFDKTYNLNIVPYRGNESTNIQNGKVKKYMFSLENLAWRTSNRPGYTYEDLPDCEKGPNGGRIMWFPPYDLTYGESVNTQWTDNTFLGRPEPIYTYSNTNRTGSLKWKIVVDHPSILNVIVDKELENESSNSTVNKVLTSFFAGCTKYDLYELVKKFPMFTPSDVFEVQQEIYYPEDVVTVVEGTYSETVETITIQDNIPQPSATPPPTAPPVTVPPTPTPTATATVTPPPTEPPPKIEPPKFGELIFFFHNDYPIAKDFPGTPGYRQTNNDYLFWLNKYKDLESDYLNVGVYADDLIRQFRGAQNKIFSYGDPSRINKTSTVLASSTYEQNTYLASYVDTRTTAISEFFNYIDEQFTNINGLLLQIAKFITEGGKIQFTLKGSASSLNTFDYNVNLAFRRIDSIKQYINNFEYNGVKLKQYIEEGKIIIKELSEGETVQLQDPKYKSVDCAKPFVNLKEEGVVSVNAMACRRVRLVDIIATPPEIKIEEPSVTSEPSESITESTPPEVYSEYVEPATTIVPEVPQPTPRVTQIVTKTQTPPQTIIEKQDPIVKQTLTQRSDLTKRLARKLLTECNYFDLIKQKDPMIYDSLRSKLKYFHPAFHSITPEGLNSRLTFLQQCMRPGDTIPTVNKDDNGRVNLIYNDVTNSVFGAPPVCVLRVGDFFHTKIVIESISFSYDEIPFDINPEGIGIQPMIAQIDLNFKFIGGHGLAGPVAKLQNALSFNYYANTEIYDERAEATETGNLEQYDAQIFQAIKDEIGVFDDPNKQRTDSKGDTIGTIKYSSYDLNSAKPFGTISYQEKMNLLADQTKNYATTTLTNLEKVNESYLLGGILIFTKDRKYTEGYFDWLTGNTSEVGYIFGKTEQIQDKVENLVRKAKQDVGNDLCPLIDTVVDYDFNDSDTRKVKKQIEKLIEEEGTKMLALLETCNSSITNDELKLVFTIDKLNYVSSGVDGLINQKGNTIVFSLTGGTAGIDPNSGAPNTFVELKQDFLKIKTELNDYYNRLYSDQLIPSGTTYEYNDQFVFDSFIDTDPNNIDASENRFFMLFGKTIISEGRTFTDKIVDDAIPNASEEVKTQWKEYFNSKLTVGNEALIPNYTRSKDIVDKRFKDFKDNYYTNKFNTFNPYNRTVQRIMDYSGQIPVIGSNGSNLNELWSEQNSSGPRYNLKKTFV